MALREKQNGWGEWSRHVLAELTRLNDSYEQLTNENKSTNNIVTELKSSITVFSEKVRNLDEATQDHEMRVRTLEKGFWKIVGAVTFASFLIQVLIKFIK